MITRLMTSYPSFGSKTNYQAEYYFPANFYGRLMKLRHPKAFRLVSRLFHTMFIAPLNFKYRKSIGYF